MHPLEGNCQRLLNKYVYFWKQNLAKKKNWKLCQLRNNMTLVLPYHVFVEENFFFLCEFKFKHFFHMFTKSYVWVFYISHNEKTAIELVRFLFKFFASLSLFGFLTAIIQYAKCVCVCCEEQTPTKF